MAYLNWISDQNLEIAVAHCYTKWSESAEDTTLRKFTSNVVDPFSLLFESSFAGISVEQWVNEELRRQTQKTIANTLGEFHQMVLGSCPGWENLGTGHESRLDVRNTERTVYAEIKNKYNTVSGSQEPEMHERMMRFATANPDCTVYLVNIIPRASGFDKVWLRKGSSNERLRKMSGENFYGLVTQRETAIIELFAVLPKVINVVAENAQLPGNAITAFSELQDSLRANNEPGSYEDYFFMKAFRGFQED